MALIRTFIFVIVICLPILVNAQVDLKARTSAFDTTVFGEAAQIREVVKCFTDRSIYVTEEVIKFRANIHSVGNPFNHKWSSVLYVELFSANGRMEMADKFLVNNHVATGEITIPAEVLTGNYYLRCYSRWMRNFGPDTYCYVPVKIINPKRPELSVVNLSEKPGTSLSERPLKKNILKFSSPSTVYKKGDTITLDLMTSDVDFPEYLEGCVTVVIREAEPREFMQVAELHKENHFDFQVNLLPDLFYSTLSGTVLQKGTEKKSVKDAAIHVTLLGDQPDYLITHSDAFGKFSIALPYREKNMQLLIQPEYSGTEIIEVSIDKDFDPRNLPIQTELFQLTEKEKQLVTLMAIKMQLSAIYRQTDSTKKIPTIPSHTPFYGSPTFSLNMNNYVLLPTLEEVFLNLIPSVTPVTRNKKTTLLIDSENPALSMYDPIIMIDEVPVFDMASFMSVPTNRIGRIDVINDVYQKGDVRFGGIINLHSKEKDIAGIDLPKNAFLIDFMPFHSSSTVTDITNSSYDRIPDTRNTLLWIPRLQVKKDTISHIIFIAPDYPGEYVVLFRGEDEQGQIISVETIVKIEQ